jgi:hypothetical protein
MYRRFPALLAALAVAALVVPAVSLAARVTVRVEGRTQTIFGPAPRVVEASNALEALERASAAGEFFYHLTTASFGRYVDQIGRYPASGTAGWVFKVNGASPPVGADAVQLRDGDTVLWYWAQFGIVPGGPPTLELRRTSGTCFRVLSVNDQGRRSAATTAVLRVDGRSVRTRAGRGCVGRHRGLVRATAPGAVRSNALR